VSKSFVSATVAATNMLDETLFELSQEHGA
jgi:hypothetical protein